MFHGQPPAEVRTSTSAPTFGLWAAAPAHQADRPPWGCSPTRGHRTWQWGFLSVSQEHQVPKQRPPYLSLASQPIPSPRAHPRDNWTVLTGLWPPRGSSTPLYKPSESSCRGGELRGSRTGRSLCISPVTRRRPMQDDARLARLNFTFGWCYPVLL